jgi:nucleoid-associated protein YgaU
MTSRPVQSTAVADALPPRTHFDSKQWLNSRQPARKGTWVKRGSAVLVTGLLGALGWVGYQQVTAAAAKSESPKNEEQFVLDGETSGTPEANFAFSKPKTAEPTETAVPLESPFDAPQAFRPMTPPNPTASPSPAAQPADNPFAAFATKQTAMAPQESPFEQAPPQINPAPRRLNADVTRTSNEAPGTSAVEIFDVNGQSEPAASANIALDQSQPVQNPAEDPFAAFAPQSVPPVEPAAAASAQFGGRAQAEVVTADAAWAAATPQNVTPVQFAPEPPQSAAPPQFEPEAKPIGTANGLAAEPAPALNRTPAATEWPPFDPQPTPMEPRAQARRLTPQPAYFPAAEPAQPAGFNVPQPAAPANDPNDEKLHVVQQGETYWSIARQHYGAGRYFQALAEYNKPRISDQAALKPGMKVLVPSATTLDTRYGKSMQASGLAKPPAKPQSGLRVDAQGRPLYVVGAGDTLGEIARRYLGKTSRSNEISRLNQEQLPNPNKLKEGMILLLPNDAAEVQSASSIPGRR